VVLNLQGCKLYDIKILIDGKEETIIDELCHHIDIIFINNITNKQVIMQKVLLVDLYIDNYYFMTNDGTILEWNKTIKRKQNNINYKEIQLDPYLLLEAIDENKVRVIDKLTKYVKYLLEILANYILIFCYMLFHIYLLFRTTIPYGI
jgi:hypothetical protein